MNRTIPCNHEECYYNIEGWCAHSGCSRTNFVPLNGSSIWVIPQEYVRKTTNREWIIGLKDKQLAEFLFGEELASLKTKLNSSVNALLAWLDQEHEENNK